MTKIYVYNNGTGRIESYDKSESDAMPYVTGNTLTVNEFRGSSNSSVFWTDKRAMDAWNSFRSYYGKPIYVGYAFKRIWEGGHGYQSQHYAGVAFDTGQNLSSTALESLRTSASQSGYWGYVEPKSLAPTWVHFDRRTGTPACSAGYPLLKNGHKGVYVFILQDALNALGYTGSGLDGLFGNGTESAVKSFQSAKGLTVDGIVGCGTWTSLTQSARGIGRTSTVVNP